MALGNPVITENGNVVAADMPRRTGTYASTISGTGSADTGGAIDTLGYAGIRFIVAYAAYRGTFLIQGSHDGTNYYTIRPFSCDAAAQTYTWHWQDWGNYRYYKVVGDPNASNAGTATVSFMLYKERPVGEVGGFCGPNGSVHLVLASADYTADLGTTLFAVKGPGCKVRVNVTAKGGGVMKFQLLSYDPLNSITGGSTGITSTLIQSAVVNETGMHTYNVTPNLAAVSNASVMYSGEIFAINTTAYDSGTYTYSITVENDEKSYAGY